MPPAPSASLPAAETDETTGETIYISSRGDNILHGQKVALSPVLLKSETARNVEKVEYYNGSHLVQTVKEPPFALDSGLLDPGRYTITERIYFLDGLIVEHTQQITIRAPKPVWIAISVAVSAAAICFLGSWYVQKREQRSRH